MNEKTMKQISKQTNVILVEWLKTLVSEEEAKKINISNLEELLPTQTHVRANNKVMLSAFSKKWVRKHLKSFVKKNPNKPIWSIKLTDVMKESTTWQNAPTI
jgi:poly-D-alanine transfer protein DltD